MKRYWLNKETPPRDGLYLVWTGEAWWTDAWVEGAFSNFQDRVEAWAFQPPSPHTPQEAEDIASPKDPVRVTVEMDRWALDLVSPILKSLSGVAPDGKTYAAVAIGFHTAADAKPQSYFCNCAVSGHDLKESADLLLVTESPTAQVVSRSMGIAVGSLCGTAQAYAKGLALQMPSLNRPHFTSAVMKRVQEITGTGVQKDWG